MTKGAGYEAPSTQREQHHQEQEQGSPTCLDILGMVNFAVSPLADYFGELEATFWRGQLGKVNVATYAVVPMVGHCFELAYS